MEDLFTKDKIFCEEIAYLNLRLTKTAREVLRMQMKQQEAKYESRASSTYFRTSVYLSELRFWPVFAPQSVLDANP
ncbi:unnamed protein product [Soboliphyme baturini]|uniref:Uncharacterized protein n=1 Tax=Soboliphyme baturini TaxID=241478 RepID=A0A183IXB4_9BILA|nr:unnamed protein product [Soboliphyme baturini]